MEKLTEYFAAFGFDLPSLLIAAGLLLAGTILLSAVGKFIFGAKSTLVQAISAAIGILFVYVLNIVLHRVGDSFSMFISPLPFLTVQGETASLFVFTGTEFSDICVQLVNMVVLALLMNLIDTLIPKGENPIVWMIFRILTIALAQVAYLVILWACGTYLPADILTYAPMILLAVLVILLLTGALKIVVGAFLTTVNPLVAALYTFFFANIIGRQVTKAVFTTALLSGLVYGLEFLEIAQFSIAPQALIAYIPLALILLALWYLVSRLFVKKDRQE